MTSDIRNYLFHEATQVASELHQGLTALEKKQTELEVELHRVKAQIESFRAASPRLQLFNSKSTGKDWACPNCWIRNGVVVHIHPIDGTDREDRFRCKSCGQEFSIPLD